MENARTRALAVVKPLNQNIGSAIQISDNEPYYINQQIQGRAAGIVLRGNNSLQEVVQTGIPNIEFIASGLQIPASLIDEHQ